MKYLFITTGCLEKNSSFVRLRQLGFCLANMGVSVHYLLDDTMYNEKLVELLEYAQVILVKKSTSNFGMRLGQVFARRQAIKSIAPNVVHFLNPSPNNTASVVKTENFITVSDWDELLSQRRPDLFQQLVLRICESIARQQADLITVSSRHLQSYFKHQFGLNSLYLPYATYLENTEIRENPFPRPTAVYMGNLHPDGDHDVLLDAWSILKKQGKDLDLCMIGGGSRLENFRAEVKERKLDSLIIVMGYLPTPEMWNRLCHAHILLFPIRDTIGNRMRCPSKTFAYMQAGRPIVTCRVGEVAEALGDQGIYVEPTPSAFAEKVTELFSRPLANINYNLERHSWQHRAEELLAAIKEKL